MGPLIERHENFPNRINVQFAKVVARDTVEILIWERGAGETMASGSSSCAVAAAAFKNGLVDKRVRVNMPGGSLEITLDETYHITMKGPAQPVMRARLLS